MGGEMGNKHYFVYIVECRDQTLYCGYTTDLNRRMKMHNEGKGAKYTRGRGPVALRYWEQGEDIHWALSREIAIKRLTSRQKRALIEEMKDDTAKFSSE